MKIHEYQAKQILNEFKIPTPFGKIAHSLEEVKEITKQIPTEGGVVKAQILAGGRGKGGGVKVVKNKEQIITAAKEILGMNLVTPQTTSKGQKVSKVLIEEGLKIKKEFYFSILVDRKTKKITILASSEGGMDIEEVAEKSPDKIIKQKIHSGIGLRSYQTRNLAFALGLHKIDKNLIRQATEMFLKFYKVFLEKDLSLLEINPLVVTANNELLPLDCKINFDENALSRHPKISPLRDISEENEFEIEASKHDLNFIKLDGNIACMVNGAGLAMATMDIIQYYKGNAANFLDVGGNTSADKIAAAFRIISKDKTVNSLFINIFGGIVRCDLVAEGILQALEETNFSIPIVARLEGTNSNEAKNTIKNKNFPNLEIISDLEKATKKAILIAQI